jgi:hypothetical protein
VRDGLARVLDDSVAACALLCGAAMMRSTSLLVLLAASALVVACGSSDSSTGETSSTDPTSPASACESTTRTLCERACACGSCVVAYGTAVTEEHKSLADCTNFYRYFVCAQPSGAGYGDACRAELESASCVTTATKGGAIAFPPDGACSGAAH